MADNCFGYQGSLHGKSYFNIILIRLLISSSGPLTALVCHLIRQGLSSRNCSANFLITRLFQSRNYFFFTQVCLTETHISTYYMRCDHSCCCDIGNNVLAGIAFTSAPKLGFAELPFHGDATLLKCLKGTLLGQTALTGALCEGDASRQLRRGWSWYTREPSDLVSSVTWWAQVTSDLVSSVT
jgi:hypothetical protein